MLTSPIYRWFQGDSLSPDQLRERNAKVRRQIWEGTGWAVIDLAEVHNDFERQLILNECERQNGKRQNKQGAAR